jgi:nickel-dependent lactate racemase
VAIAISDNTRPVPHSILLPPLLRELVRVGIAPSAITFIIATGLHRAMHPDEFGQVLPEELVAQYKIVSHDATKGTKDLGITARGTPILINDSFAAADLRIVIGNLEPHQFMGFSGGVKTAAIGCAGAETINRNHALMQDPRSDLGVYEGNPARMDVEEIGEKAGIHFALNAVINESKQIIDVLAGDPREVMLKGIPLVRKVYCVRVPERFDMVIVSPGGHPKDINVYQAQKALGHAARVCKREGTIVLAAACPEGSGSSSYENWVAGCASHEQVLQRFQSEGFRIGPHKAFQIARDAVSRRVLVITDMPDALARKLLLEKYASIEAAIASACTTLPDGARIGIMPFGNATIPEVTQI